MNHYTPGLHLIGDVHQAPSRPLSDMEACRLLMNELVKIQGLQKVGEVYHSFDGAGYTATICLTESHVAIHTWPEFGRVTFDVFLSNFMNNNDAKGEAIFDALIAFFESSHFTKQSIRR